MSRVIGEPARLLSGSRAVRSGLIVVQVMPSSVVGAGHATPDRPSSDRAARRGRRSAREAVFDVVRIVAVAVLRIDPVVLLLAGRDVIASEFSLAGAPDDRAVRTRTDLSGLAPDPASTTASGRRSPRGGGRLGTMTWSCPAAARRVDTGTARPPRPCTVPRSADSGSTTRTPPSSVTFAPPSLD